MSPETTYIVIINNMFAYEYEAETSEGAIQGVIELYKKKAMSDYEEHEEAYKLDKLTPRDLQEIERIDVYTKYN